jgi:hypothetical protein
MLILGQTLQFHIRFILILGQTLQFIFLIALFIFSLFFADMLVLFLQMHA